jgi:hypothetical protein
VTHRCFVSTFVVGGGGAIVDIIGAIVAISTVVVVSGGVDVLVGTPVIISGGGAILCSRWQCRLRRHMHSLREL